MSVKATLYLMCQILVTTAIINQIAHSRNHKSNRPHRRTRYFHLLTRLSCYYNFKKNILKKQVKHVMWHFCCKTIPICCWLIVPVNRIYTARHLCKTHGNFVLCGMDAATFWPAGCCGVGRLKPWSSPMSLVIIVSNFHLMQRNQNKE